MSTWIEIEMETRGGQPWHQERLAVAPSLPARSFHERRGTGTHTFSQRLSRARILYLLRRETHANWLALAIACAFVAPALSGQSDFSSSAARGIPASPEGNSFRATENELRALQSTPAVYR